MADAGTAGVVENRFVLAQFAHQPTQAKLRRRVRAGAERKPGIEYEVDGVPVDRFVP
jgi:hypothetical protein